MESVLEQNGQKVSIPASSLSRGRRPPVMHMTPSRMAAAALRVACILQRPAIDYWAGQLAGVMICEPGYERPTGGRLQSMVERQGLPAMPHAPDLLVAEREFIDAHVRAALGLAHPLARLSAQAVPDLRSAVKWVSSFRGPGAADGISTARREMLALFKRVIDGTSAEQSLLLDVRWEFAEPTTALLAPPAEIALVACLIKARGWPDSEFTLCQVVGFPCYGTYRDSGVFREEVTGAGLRLNELDHKAHAARVESTLRRLARDASDDESAMEALRIITRKTEDEVEAGLAFGPFTSDEVDAKFGKGEWRVLHRFAVEQGVDDHGRTKYRVCDNAKSSKTNM